MIIPTVALRELRQARCACGATKEPGLSLCGPCYKTLPISLQRPLYKRIGHGYEAALEDAIHYLGHPLPSETTINDLGLMTGQQLADQQATD